MIAAIGDFQNSPSVAACPSVITSTCSTPSALVTRATESRLAEAIGALAGRVLTGELETPVATEASCAKAGAANASSTRANQGFTRRDLAKEIADDQLDD